MNTIRFSTTRTLTLLACASLLTACGAGKGYYDNKGNFIAGETPYGTTQARHEPGRKVNDNSDQIREYDSSAHGNYAPYRTTYERSGFYDHNGDYSISDNPINVPQNMFPQRGMCRVWFTNRVPANQPAIESCDAIKSRVPAGAYVIYGG